MKSNFYSFIKREKSVKRQLKFELESLENGEKFIAFEWQDLNLKTEQLQIGSILKIKGDLLFVNQVLMLAKGTVTIDKISSSDTKSALTSCEQNLKRIQSITPSRLKPLRKRPKVDPKLEEEMAAKARISGGARTEILDTDFDEEIELLDDDDEDSLEELGSDFSEHQQPAMKSNTNKLPHAAAQLSALAFDDDLEFEEEEEHCEILENNCVAIVELLSMEIGAQKEVHNCLIVNCRDGNMVMTDGTSTALVKNKTMKMFQEGFKKSKLEWNPTNLFNAMYSVVFRRSDKLLPHVELIRITNIQIE